MLAVLLCGVKKTLKRVAVNLDFSIQVWRECDSMIRIADTHDANESIEAKITSGDSDENRMLSDCVDNDKT